MKRKSLLVCSILSLLLSAVSPCLRAQNSGFVYLSNSPSNANQPGSILGYAVSDDTGALTAVPGSPFQIQLSGGGSSLAVTPSGRFLYTPTATYSASTGTYSVFVVAYSIDASSGALTPVPGSPFYAEANSPGINWLTMDPAGKFLYAMNTYFAEIFVYSIDQNTGALTLQPSSPFPTQQGYPAILTLGATGQFAYVTYAARSGSFNGAISAYRIDLTNGSFTVVPGSPFMIPNDPSSANKNGPNPTWAAAHPSAGFLYVADSNQLDLWTFTIDGTSGALTLSPSSPMQMPHGSNQFAIDPTGSFAYFTTLYPNSTDCAIYYPYTNVYAPDSVFVYSIDQASGALSPASSPVAAAGYQPVPVATDPSGRFAYALNLQGYNFDPSSSNISAYRIHGESGRLTPVLGSPFPAGVNAAPTLVVAAAQNKN